MGMTSHLEIFGSSIRRLEDRAFLNGSARYVDDIKLEHSLFLGFVRSPYAHAAIKSVRLGKALSHTGVAAGVDGKELIANSSPLPVYKLPGQKTTERWPLATEKVRYVGEPVAAIAAADRYVVEDGLELAEVDYEPLPPVIDPQKALNSNSPLVYDGLGTNLIHEMSVESGNVKEAFTKADHISRGRISFSRQAAIPIEPRSIIAQFDEKNGVLTAWISSQSPHRAKEQIAETLRLDANSVRVIAPCVGGGFGSKGTPAYEEYMVACYLAMRTRTPVKWTSTRTEDFLASAHGRDQIHDYEIALRKDGTILGLKDVFISDLGVVGSRSTAAQRVTQSLILGNYKIKNFHVRSLGVTTNKTALGPVRGFGRCEATFLIERALNKAARELSIDQAEIRFRNFIGKDEFPYTTGTGTVYDSGDFATTLRTVLEQANYKQLRSQQLEKNQDCSTTRLGVGIACSIEETGGAGGESARVILEKEGSIRLLTGAAPHGQGLLTSLAQIVAQTFQIPVGNVKVVYGDTAEIPFGVGTFGSRSAVVAGGAAMLASQQLLEKLKRSAMEILNSDHVVYESSSFHSPDGRRLSLMELWNKLSSGKIHQDDNRPLEHSVIFKPESTAFSNAAHVAVVEVDVQTGMPEILGYFIASDCGIIINPMIVDGQLMGGTAHGIGGALYEELLYNEDGQLLTTSLMDYAIPESTNVPDFTIAHVCTPSPYVPTGVKGVGESGTITAISAIANAIEDVLSSFRITVDRVPVSPEKILASLR